MTYADRLEKLLGEILDQFEDDPSIGWIHYDTNNEPVIVSSDLSDLLDRANDAVYGSEEGDDYTEDGECISGDDEC